MHFFWTVDKWTLNTFISLKKQAFDNWFKCTPSPQDVVSSQKKNEKKGERTVKFPATRHPKGRSSWGTENSRATVYFMSEVKLVIKQNQEHSARTIIFVFNNAFAGSFQLKKL